MAHKSRLQDGSQVHTPLPRTGATPDAARRPTLQHKGPHQRQISAFSTRRQPSPCRPSGQPRLVLLRRAEAALSSHHRRRHRPPPATARRLPPPAAAQKRAAIRSGPTATEWRRGFYRTEEAVSWRSGECGGKIRALRRATYVI